MKSFSMQNRIVAALVCVCLVAGVLVGSFLRGSDVASASSSLAGIMQLKSSSEEYLILEVVPDVSQAAFAWYVGDSEPVNNRKLSIAYSGDMAGYETSYRTTTGMLEAQGYLLSSEVNGAPSDSILGNIGSISPSGSLMEGGFESNEWFLRYVLDWTEDELMPNIRVLPVTPEDLTTVHLDMADMVVLSGGYYYPDTTVSPTAYGTDSNKNLSKDVADELISRVSGVGASGNSGLALILDRRAYNAEGGTSLQSNRVFHEVLQGDPRNVASGVYGSVFYYSSVTSGSEVANGIVLENGSLLGSSSGTAMGYLVTPEFHSAFSSSMASGNFSVVLKSIQEENASRGGLDTLSEEITMARVVRYLVGGRDTTSVSVSDKSTVSILSIQPGSASGTAVYDAGTHGQYGLSAPSATAKVSLPTNPAVDATGDQVSWDELERWTGVSRFNITVVEKTIQEFVNSSEAISGNYDMIYIGSDISSSAYGVYGETSQFVGNSVALANPNGLTYFAPVGSDLKTPGTTYTAVSNDLSVARYKEMLEFISAGRPVVLAPYLCAGLNWLTDWKTPSTATVDKDSRMYSLLSGASGRSNVIRQDMLVAGPDGVEGTSDDSSMLATCQSAVHLSAPSISLMTLSNSLNDGAVLEPVIANGVSAYELEYVFQLTDETVSSSSAVTYTVNLMLDLDGDGIYETDCRKFDDLTVEQLQTGSDGSLLLDGSGNVLREQAVGLSSLRQNQYYRVTVTLPDSVTGYVPWRLSVVSSEASGAVSYASSGYSVNAAATSVKVLQVDSESNNHLQLKGLTSYLYGNLDFSAEFMDYKSFNTGTDLSAYNMIVVGTSDFLNLITEDSQGELYSALEKFEGAILLSYNTLQKEDLENHFFANLAQGDMDQLSVSPYPNVDSTLSEDQFLAYKGNVFFTNQELTSSASEETKMLFVNTLASALGITEAPPVVEGGGNEEEDSENGNGTSSPNFAHLSIYSDDDLKNVLSNGGSTYKISENLLKQSQLVPVYVTMPHNTNNFKIDLRFKSINSDDWDYDSANMSNGIGKTSLTVHQFIGDDEYALQERTASKELTWTYDVGDTIEVFDSRNYIYVDNNDAVNNWFKAYSSESTFAVNILPSAASYMEVGGTYQIEIYLTTADGVEFANNVFEITVEKSSNMVAGNDFFYYEYVENNAGNYIKDENGDYVLADNKGLGQLYLQMDKFDYRPYLTGLEYRPVTHYRLHGWFADTYKEMPVSEEDLLLIDATLNPVSYWIYSDFMANTDSGTHYYDPETDKYELVPESTGDVQYYNKDTNMNDFTLFNIG